jgi:hypothetical protein
MRFLRWLFQHNDIRPIPEIGDRVSTGYAILTATEMTASHDEYGRHVVTVTFVKKPGNNR